jgi:hypothetical protein
VFSRLQRRSFGFLETVEILYCIYFRRSRMSLIGVYIGVLYVYFTVHQKLPIEDIVDKREIFHEDK